MNYRHVVFTIDEGLWNVLLFHRKMLKEFMDEAVRMIKEQLRRSIRSDRQGDIPWRFFLDLRRGVALSLREPSLLGQPQSVTGISPVIREKISPVVRIKGTPPVNSSLFRVKAASTG
ncbi:hypothetical protein [Bacillus sp. 3255]|uniref:hypothetical protein n=1 Tax=Bacillus sp. 3255 TaxID=2817904 RepID=UPI00286758F0|nr:hypothetical protein [Bacillus sp. 3255]MDR6880904.1 hypothetical protein [Bacillus sp. 3255]